MERMNQIKAQSMYASSELGSALNIIIADATLGDNGYLVNVRPKTASVWIFCKP